MKLMKVFFIIWTFLCVTFTINASSKNDSLITEYQFRADSFFAAKNYSAALLDCERIIFLSNNIELRNRFAMLKANCYKNLGDYKHAAQSLMGVRTIGLPRNDAFDVFYQISLNAYLAGEYAEAASQILKLEMLDPEKSMNPASFLLRILILNELNMWDSAQALIAKAVFINQNEKQQLLMHYQNKPKILNAKRLEWYSRFIPGSGQILAGRPVEGSISFLLCASALSFGILHVYYGYYFTGYFLGAGFLNGFYYGGIRRLGLIVENENQRRAQTMNNSARILLKDMMEEKIQ